MTDTSYFRLQLIVFAMVSASFTNIYITQPVLPILQTEFAADMVIVYFCGLLRLIPISAGIGERRIRNHPTSP
jgi:hypothetical protein